MKNRSKRTERNSRGFADDELTKRRRDLKEIFDFGHVLDAKLPANHPDNHVMDGFNQWPDAGDCAGFQPAMEQYFDACAGVADCLLFAILSGLFTSLFPGVTAKQLTTHVRPVTSAFQSHTSFLRLNFYPRHPELLPPDPDPDPSTTPHHPPDPSSMPLGISRHTDAGVLTLLRQDTVSGLQVYSGTKQDQGDGVWTCCRCLARSR